MQALSSISPQLNMTPEQVIDTAKPILNALPGGFLVTQAIDAFTKTVQQVVQQVQPRPEEVVQPAPAPTPPPAPPIFTVSASWSVEIAKATFDVNRFVVVLNNAVRQRLTAMGYEVTEVTTDIAIKEALDRIAIDATTTVKAKQRIDKDKLLEVLKWAIPAVCTVLGLSIIAGPGGEKVTTFVATAGGIVILILLMLLLLEREKRR
jgi:hypothetical protein